METLDRDWESKSKLSGDGGKSFDENYYEEQISGIKTEKSLAKQEAQIKVDDLKSKLFENTDNNHEKVQEFIRDNCSEPIPGIDKIVSFKDLVAMLVKGAEEGGKIEVKKSILEGNAKDKRIYELKAYKDLIKKGFILPSDNRSYKNEQYHLGVDYNVKAGFEVRSIYNGKVVASGLDGGLGHRVIVEHSMPDGITKFYSLYAHLGPEYLPKEGHDVKTGDIIGRVGAPFTKDNGDWEEHLHFQIMEKPGSPKGYSEVNGEGNYDVLKSFGKE